MALSTHGVVHEVFDPYLVKVKTDGKFRDILDILIYSSVFLSLECVATTYVSFYLQNLPCPPAGLVIPFLATFAIYNLNRRTDEDEDAINCRDRYSFTKRHERFLFRGALGAVLLVMILSVLYSLQVLLVTMIPFLFGTLYSVRLLPPVTRYRRLKEIPVVKNLVVGISWALPASLLPVYLNATTPDMKTALTCLTFIAWGFIASASPDIRDRTGDAQSGVRTIPVILGESRTIRLLLWINLVTGSLIVIASLAVFPGTMTGIFLGITAYSHVALSLLGRPYLKDLVCDVLIDGQYLFIGAALAALRYLQVFPWLLPV